MPNDVITLSTFGMQEKWASNKDAVKKFIDGQIDNIKAMKASFDSAAHESGRGPPEIILSALMIPQWKSGDKYTGQNYESPEYQQIKTEYFTYLKAKAELAGIKVQDFYSEAATKNEQQYLHQLEALGSTADLIKNRAIINNQENRHLQIDTNTIIVDRKAFYKATLGAEKQQDGMNASYYDDSGMYVSPHNKVVYTCPASEFTKNLAHQHNSYVTESKDRTDRKTPSSNQIYSTAFCKAAMDTGLVTLERAYYKKWNNLWGCYPVNLEHPTFQMSQHIITAINMSWSQGDGKVDYCAALKSIKVPVRSENNEETILDFPSFSYLIKKYTHAELKDSEREKLLAISDKKYDHHAIQSFVGHVINQKDISLLGPLLRVIPNNEGGKPLLNLLFNAFKNTEAFQDMLTNPAITSHVTPENLEALASFLPEESEFAEQKKNLLAQNTALLVQRSIDLVKSLVATTEYVTNEVSNKLEQLGAPYAVTETDKKRIAEIVGSLAFPDSMQDQTLEQFKQNAVSATTNRLLNEKLKQQPEISKALQDQEETVKNKINKKIYIPPANEKFNRVEINNMVNHIISDIGFIRAQATRDAFFEDAKVDEYIKDLNHLAAERPFDANREIQIERMSEALTNAVRSFSSTAKAPSSMHEHLQKHCAEVQKKYEPSLSPSAMASTSEITVAFKDKFKSIKPAEHKPPSVAEDETQTATSSMVPK